MFSNHLHPSDEDLIRAADGELAGRERLSLNAHLEHCWSCRERLDSLEMAIHSLVRSLHATENLAISPIAGPKALLKARLTEAANQSPGFHFAWSRLLLIGTAIPLVVLLISTVETVANAHSGRPDPRLTPGEVRPISLREVCSQPNAEVVHPNIPEELQKQVFSEYGVKPSKAGQYEVDYLITSDLGGTDSIRNIWPQAYSTRWNAKKKDELEQRLHQLVCSGALDLNIAQRDMSSDWVAAYTKYIHARK